MSNGASSTQSETDKKNEKWVFTTCSQEQYDFEIVYNMCVNDVLLKNIIPRQRPLYNIHLAALWRSIISLIRIICTHLFSSICFFLSKCNHSVWSFREKCIIYNILTGHWLNNRTCIIFLLTKTTQMQTKLGMLQREIIN